ncbi:MAG: hypothetical protein HC786_14290 [Richelia sp. CSU_2_1]|nr:hypothetical protein [Microcoleus sp. SU_5_6]NJR23236.1 hypothetical protein [Richelia sp. CSU_2_1]
MKTRPSRSPPHPLTPLRIFPDPSQLVPIAIVVTLAFARDRTNSPAGFCILVDVTQAISTCIYILERPTMLEKLLLAAALTLSLQIFAGASHSAKLPKSYVFRSLLNPATVPKPSTGCSNVICSGDLFGQILPAGESTNYSR